MSAKCKFIYNGHTGPRGKVCGRPESDHCGYRYGESDDSEGLPPHPPHDCKNKVHHTFTRTRRCPTCGCQTDHTAKGKRRNA